VTIEIFVDSAPLAGVGDVAAPAALEFSAPRPNPTRDGATFAFALPRGGDVTLQVLDVSGRVVRTLAPGTLPAGRHELRWDRRDSNGSAARPGVYWARLACTSAAGTSSRRQKIVVLD
jgi:hypothetical protein